MSDTTQSGADTKPHKAGAFDIRNIIGALLGLYGVILALAGLLGDPEYDKTGDVNANLWTGVVLIVGAAIFIGTIAERELCSSGGTPHAVSAASQVSNPGGGGCTW